MNQLYITEFILCVEFVAANKQNVANNRLRLNIDVRRYSKPCNALSDAYFTPNTYPNIKLTYIYIRMYSTGALKIRYQCRSCESEAIALSTEGIRDDGTRYNH